MGANDPQGMASLNPRGMIGRIYVGVLNLVAHAFLASEKKVFEGSLAI